MTIQALSLVRLALGAVMLVLAGHTPVAAQDTRAIRLVVPAPPGGNLDLTARMLAQRLGALTGENYVVENRPGANTQIATELVVRAPADGRTLLLAGTGIATIALLQRLNFSPLDDLAPVAQVSHESYVLAVAASSSLTSLAQLRGLATQRPGGLNCSAVPGSTTMACEQLKLKLEGKLTTVPFGGVAPALNALIGGHTDLMFITNEIASKQLSSGRIRVLAQSGRRPLQGVDAPLLQQVWPDFFLEGSAGILVPVATPPATIAQINRDINQVLAMPAVAAAMRESGQEPAGGEPDHYFRHLRYTAQRYGEIIRRLGLEPR